MRFIRKIQEWAVTDIVEIKVPVPLWLIFYIVLLPVIAYGGLIMFGGRGFIGYLITSSIEVIFVYIGFVIAINTIRVKHLEK